MKRQPDLIVIAVYVAVLFVAVVLIGKSVSW